MAGNSVLLIDDETMLTENLSAWLSGRGLSVKTAASGEEGLAILKQDATIGVAVLDINMPGLDGLETLKAIKATRPDVETIFMTGYPTVEYALEGMRLGAFEYLTKPIDIKILLQCITDALRRAAQKQSDSSTG